MICPSSPSQETARAPLRPGSVAPVQTPVWCEEGWAASCVGWSEGHTAGFSSAVAPSVCLPTPWRGAQSREAREGSPLISGRPLLLEPQLATGQMCPLEGLVSRTGECGSSGLPAGRWEIVVVVSCPLLQLSLRSWPS